MVRPAGERADRRGGEQLGALVTLAGPRGLERLEERTWVPAVDDGCLHELRRITSSPMLGLTARSGDR